MVNANNSFGFDRKVKGDVVKAANYPKLSEYFKKQNAVVNYNLC